MTDAEISDIERWAREAAAQSAQSPAARVCREDVPALVAALREARAALERLSSPDALSPSREPPGEMDWGRRLSDEMAARLAFARGALNPPKKLEISTSPAVRVRVVLPGDAPPDEPTEPGGRP